MRNFIALMAAALLMASLPSIVGAETLIKNLPDKGTVALVGIIDKVVGDREFVLRDPSGTIDVKITSNQSVVIKPGEKVNLIGSVSNSFLGLADKSIDAVDVKVEQGPAATVTNALAATTGVSVDAAKTVKIDELPPQGMVRILGTVDSVGGPKNFTLKDASGSVDVDVESGENVALQKGAEVIVIGYVDKGLLSKSIRATRVIVSDNAIPSMGGT